MKHYPVGFIVIYLIFIGCQEVDDREPPETVSVVLNEFVSSAPYQYINLDEVELQEIVLSEEDIIYHLHREVKEEEPLLGHLTIFTYNDEQFYVYDAVTNAIFKIDKNGTIEGPLTREGRGPGELGLVRNIKANDQYIWVSDAINARINRYTHDLVSVDFPVEISSFLDLNDEFVFLENNKSSGISPVKPDQGRIAVLSMDSLTDTLTTILPRIVPSGYQPQLYNTPRVVINQNNSTVANYYFLPWLILFDKDFNHSSTIIVEYSKFEEMDIPPMDFFKHLTNEGFGGVRPITEYKLMDNGDIFISVRRELIRLTPLQNGDYQVAGRYRFHHYMQDEPLWISDIFQTDRKDRITIGSWEYLFRVELPD
ncbi:hypothetical protein DYD21_08360 [Rhodohalobacter sp. SW132]|uniref:6-bladed beta-propeller n=1 Tax=Rhodohalobacter sp. SW132 TaxID=2293433 RepID=UPI000E26EE08|nr:6-bladed beta-propeller [Rhodohalobacter sp. SW132]REL37783.1 hypothetical protein DYD21_08360 [Rhodohalobacter sp. SW132]